MASTFSPTLRLELIGDGDQSGIWGQTTNNNLGGLIEQAITGVATIAMVDANYTLTNFNGVVDEARNQVLVLTGALSQQRNLIAPLAEKTYTIRNTTTGGFGVQVIGSSGTGVVIPNGVTASVFCDGTNFFPATTGSLGNQTINGNLAVTGTTSLTGALTGSSAVFAGSISAVNPTFTGIPTAPTASAGTSTTQIATTAFVQNVAGALGTMSTQNANNVNITGGTITGSYGLTAANATNATTVTTTVASGATGTTQPVGTDNNTLATTAFVRDIIPAGVILMWSGSIASIPSGWVLCNGANGTPNLQDRFIVGAGSAYGVNATGGSTASTATGSVSGSIGGTAITEAQMPKHFHRTWGPPPVYTGPSVPGVDSPGFSYPGRGNFNGGTPDDGATDYGTWSVGGDGTSGGTATGTGPASAHTHSLSVSFSGGSIPTLPPYYALAYIMKT